LVAVVSAAALKSRPNGPLKPTMFPAMKVREPMTSPRLIRWRAGEKSAGELLAA